MSPFLSDCPSLMLGIAIHCIQPSQAMLERGVCELAHSFFHWERNRQDVRLHFEKHIENGQRGLKTSDNTVKRIKQVLD